MLDKLNNQVNQQKLEDTLWKSAGFRTGTVLYVEKRPKASGSTDCPLEEDRTMLMEFIFDKIISLTEGTIKKAEAIEVTDLDDKLQKMQEKQKNIQIE